jgi:hypothetical protein
MVAVKVDPQGCKRHDHPGSRHACILFLLGSWVSGSVAVKLYRVAVGITEVDATVAPLPFDLHLILLESFLQLVHDGAGDAKTKVIQSLSRGDLSPALHKVQEIILLGPAEKKPF